MEFVDFNIDISYLILGFILLVNVYLLITLKRTKDYGTNLLLQQHFTSLTTQISSISESISRVLAATVGEKASSYHKGQKFQEFVYLALKGAFPDDNIIYTAPEPHKGDIIAYPRIKLPTGAIIDSPIPIVIDAKEYSSPVGRNQLLKLFGDMERLKALLGILVVSDDRTINHYSNRYVSDGRKTIFLVSGEGKAFLALYAMIRYSLSLLQHRGVDLSKIVKIIEHSSFSKTITELESIYQEISTKIESWERRLRVIRSEMEAQVKNLISKIQQITLDTMDEKNF